MNLGARQMSVTASEDQGFEALFTAEYARVVGIANRVLADPHEAEDVAQEVFIDYHRLHSARADYAPAWLHRAAAHSSLNRLRGARRRQKREFAQAIEEGERTLDPQKQLEIDEDRRRVREALGRMAPKPAAVLVLRAGARRRHQSDRNFVETRGRHAAQGGHSWHTLLTEHCAGWSTTPMRKRVP